MRNCIYSQTVKLGFNPINPTYANKILTIKIKQYFTYGCIINQQYKDVISLYVNYSYTDHKLKMYAII